MVAISADREEIITDNGIFSLEISECKGYVTASVTYTNMAGAEIYMFKHEEDYKNMFGVGEAIEQLKGCMHDLYESLCNERPIDFITLFDI